MNQAIIDNTILASAAISALLINHFTSDRKTGKVVSFFLLFAPLVVFLNMWGHTIAVSIVNIKRYQAGTFQYSFSFYSLLLFGIVFLVVSGYNIHFARKIIKGDLTQKPKVLWMNLSTALLFMPLFVINPIALLPVLASIVSSLALWSIRCPVQTVIYDKRNRSRMATESV